MSKLIKFAALAAVLAAFFGFYCTPLWDMDFWWHIANGRHIVETHIIPEHDPFGMYEASGVTSDTILKNYWLAQIALFFTYDSWGASGIIFLKASMLAFCLVVTFVRSMLVGAGWASALLVLSFTGMTLLDFTGERPQLFSFLFFPLMILLFDFSREKNALWPLYLLPMLTLLWANSHGGVTLGGVVLCILALGYAVERRWFAGENYGGKWIFIALAATVLCTFISPNGINNYLFLFTSQLGESEELRNRTSEYASPITIGLEMGKMLPFYWGFILLAMFTLTKAIRKPHFTPLLVILFLGGLSLKAFRYIPFFMLYAAPYVALGLTRLTASIKLPTTSLYGVLLVGALFMLGDGVRHGKAFQSGVQANRFPQGAVDFMKRSGLAGKVFNAYTWGGYLTWYLNPQIKVFIDGRNLDIQRFRDYTHILWATPYGLQQLELNHFDFVLIPHSNIFTGEKYNLNAYLLQSPQWRMIYRDQSGYLFSRESGVLR